MYLTYACSAHLTNSAINFYRGRREFVELSKLLEAVSGIKRETLDTLDVTLAGNDISLLKTLLEPVLSDALKGYQEIPYPGPGTRMTVFGITYGLDLRKDDHRVIYNLGYLLNMAVKEMENKGTIWFYRIPDFAVPYFRLIGLFKSQPDGLTTEAAIVQFRKWEPGVAGISSDEFARMIGALKAGNFISDRESEYEATLWYPTEKALRIDSI